MLQIQGLQHTYNKYLKENFIITLLITKIKTYEKNFIFITCPYGRNLRQRAERLYN